MLLLGPYLVTSVNTAKISFFLKILYLNERLKKRTGLFHEFPLISHTAKNEKFFLNLCVCKMNSALNTFQPRQLRSDNDKYATWCPPAENHSLGMEEAANACIKLGIHWRQRQAETQ